MDSNCRLSPASCLSVPLEFDTARMLTVMWCRHSRKHPPATVPQTYPDLPNWNGLPVLCQLARASAAASAWRRMELLRPPVAVGQVGKPAVRSSIGPVTLCHESFQHRQSDGHSTSFGKRLHLPDSTSGPQMSLWARQSSTKAGFELAGPPPRNRRRFPLGGRSAQNLGRSIPLRFRLPEKSQSGSQLCRGLRRIERRRQCLLAQLFALGIRHHRDMQVSRLPIAQ